MKPKKSFIREFDFMKFVLDLVLNRRKNVEIKGD